MSAPATAPLAERAAASRQALADARKVEQDRRIALAEATGAVEFIEASWRRGDDTKTATDLLTAQAELTRAKALHETAEAAVKRATGALVNEDTTLADALAGALRPLDRFAGYAVIATAEPPTTTGRPDRPHLYVVQETAPTPDLVSGRVSGRVTLTLVRPDWAVALDVDDLPELVFPAQVYIDTHHTRTAPAEGGIAVDTAEITARGVWPSLPHIRSVNGVEMFGQILARRAAAHASHGHKGEFREPAYGGLSSTSARTAAVSGDGTGQVTEASEADGKRTTTVTADLAFTSTVVGGARIVESVRSFIENLSGTCEEGIGRIASAKVAEAPIEHGDGRANAPIRVRATLDFVSAIA